ncbi:MAG: hypothetical protein HOP31_08365 [Ignavibacteria bacterium]|nr:hypothetical protein [Ignavibacteria bacterium]
MKNNNNGSGKWIGFHLYYEEPWEDLLSRCIFPLVLKLKKGKKINKFFFIRYWESGPHIRLRLNVSEENLINTLKKIVVENIHTYFEKYPSYREDKDYNKYFSKLYENNSIQIIEYMPEIDRYGGINAMNISESQFCASSEATLKVIKLHKSWNYDTAMGYAIKLNLSFARVFFENNSDLLHFYSLLTNQMFTLIPGLYYGKEESDFLKNKNEFYSVFENEFQKQESNIVPYIFSFLGLIDNENNIKDTWLRSWMIEMKKVKDELHELEKLNKIKYPGEDIINVNINRDYGLWYIYFSYIHMINNRLGIKNRDESFLSFLIKRSIGKINGEITL